MAGCFWEVHDLTAYCKSKDDNFGVQVVPSRGDNSGEFKIDAEKENSRELKINAETQKECSLTMLEDGVSGYED